MDNVLSQTLRDSAGNVITTQSWTYDANGNVLTTTNGDGDVTLNVYDANRLISSTVGYGTTAAVTTSYTYDAVGNVTSETDPDSNVTTYTYDAAGNVLTVTNALGTTTNTYDLASNLTSTTDAAGRTITYAYDANRLSTEIWFNADSSVADTLTYTYDANGNILTASNNAGTVTMTYDAMGNVLTQTDANGLTLTYSYDADGNVLSIQDSQGGLTTMTYNAAGQVLTKTYQDATSQLQVDFTYDLAGNLLTETRYSDAAGTQLAGTTHYSYDGNQLTSIVQTDANGNTISSFNYTYDQAGWLTSQTVNGVTTYFTYDATGQLIQSGSQSYSYDANGNPNGSGTSIGPDNELLSDGTWNYTYDAVGNLVQQVSLDGALTWTYEYNNANELTSAVESSSGAAILQINYTYDVFGNRISETVTQNGTTTTTLFSYDANNTLYATENSSGTIQTRYFSGVGGPDLWLAQVDATGDNNSAWLLSDYQGTVTSVVSMSNGSYTNITYDPYGNVTNTSCYLAGGTITTASNAPAVPMVGFQGGLADPYTGFVHFGSTGGRDYNPVTQRWLQQDPTGLQAGPNPYEAFSNAPTNYTDSLGTDATMRVMENGAGQHYVPVSVVKDPQVSPWLTADAKAVAIGTFSGPEHSPGENPHGNRTYGGVPHIGDDGYNNKVKTVLGAYYKANGNKQITGEQMLAIADALREGKNPIASNNFKKLPKAQQQALTQALLGIKSFNEDITQRVEAAAAKRGKQPLPFPKDVKEATERAKKYAMHDKRRISGAFKTALAKAKFWAFLGLTGTLAVREGAAWNDALRAAVTKLADRIEGVVQAIGEGKYDNARCLAVGTGDTIMENSVKAAIDELASVLSRSARPDLVFISGLAGDAFETWFYQNFRSEVLENEGKDYLASIGLLDVYWRDREMAEDLAKSDPVKLQGIIDRLKIRTQNGNAEIARLQLQRKRRWFITGDLDDMIGTAQRNVAEAERVLQINEEALRMSR